MQKNNKEVVNVIEKLICVNKVSKATTGGNRLSFAALVVAGDGKGRVGYGTGKTREVGDARNKAAENAKKAMIRVPLKEGRTIHHECEGRYGCGHVVLRPAPAGTGIISGGPMRAVFECLGIKDIVSKSIGTNNPYNMILATFEALKSMDSPKNIADRRSKHVSEIIKRRNVIVNNDTTQDCNADSVNENGDETEYVAGAIENVSKNNNSRRG
jgi:small subunit ribosomal protein S5